MIDVAFVQSAVLAPIVELPPFTDNGRVTALSRGGAMRAMRLTAVLGLLFLLAPPMRGAVLPQSPAAAPAKATIADMAWLSGIWKGQMGAASLEECWTPGGGGAMLGVSRTIANNKMVEFEFLRIIERDGTLIYVAQPNGRTPATEFTLTKFGANEAKFENPSHDYPKIITYTLAADGTLTAVIADTGGAKARSFVFKRSQA